MLLLKNIYCLLKLHPILVHVVVSFADYNQSVMGRKLFDVFGLFGLFPELAEIPGGRKGEVVVPR